MAKNDKILVDGIIDERIELKVPSNKRDEAFEFFVFEQLLKDYDLSKDDIAEGSVDGQNDGGIDGFFIFVNGHNLQDPDNFIWPKSGAILEVWIITCKLHDTFKQAPLDNLVASIHELFDFSLENVELKGEYSDRILNYRSNLKLAYRKVSPRLSGFSIKFCYASRGNTAELGDSIFSRSQQLTQIATEAFGNCNSAFLFIGATELIDLHRKTPNFTLELPIIKDLSHGENYILLVSLKEFFNFIQDKGKLRRYLFDSNVRDFMGLNRVNEDIRATLTDIESPDFWWLNNGITILATHAFIIGEVIHIEDIQIVNGLQTSESIFRHFESGGDDPKNRSVLVKVLVCKDDRVRDTIIRATNNQTSVELASLHATDKIQRDIEDVLKQSDIYYERRVNHYKNQGVPPEKIITPLYLASGYVSLALKQVDQASRLKSRFMRSELSYNQVFSQSVDLSIWPKIASILKCTDSYLETVRPNGKKNSENFLKSRRQLLSFLTISRLIGSFDFPQSSIAKFDIVKLTKEEFDETWGIMKFFGPYTNNSKIKREHFLGLCKKASKLWGIDGLERILKANGAVNFDNSHKKGNFKESSTGEILITREFAMMIHELLPTQPWKPGIDREVAKIAKCTRNEYFAAVKILIDEGLRFQQKDGIVYNPDGSIVSIDTSRVDPETLNLKQTS